MSVTVRELLTKWGFESDTQPIDRLNQSLEDAKTTVTLLGAQAIAQVGALFGLTHAVATQGDEMAKTAKRIGVNVEALQEYSHVANLAGADTNQFNTALEGLTLGIAEARKGGGKLIEPLIRINQLTGKDLLTSMGNADEMMLELADSFAQMTDETEKAELASKIFGGSGLAMVNVLNQGSTAIRQQRNEARELGVVLSEDSARQSEHFVDTLLRLKSVFLGLRNAIGIELMPEIIEYMKILTQWIKDNKEIIKTNVSIVLASMVKGFRKLMDMGRRMLKVIRGVITAFGGLENIITVALAALTTFTAFKFLTSIGNLTLAVGTGLVKAFMTAGNAALLAQAKMMLLPLAIGAAVAGIFLLVDDIKAFIEGRDSIIGLLFKNFDKIGEKIGSFLGGLTESVKSITKTALTSAIDFFSSLSADDFKGFGNALLKALELAVNVSTLPFRIGMSIAEGILEGLTETIKERFPNISKFLGITEVEKTPQREQADRAVMGSGFLGANIGDVVRNTQANAAAAGIVTPKARGSVVVNQNNTINNTNNIPPGTSPDEASEIVEQGQMRAMEKTAREVQAATSTNVEI